jgi:hypothetical protein
VGTLINLAYGGVSKIMNMKSLLRHIKILENVSKIPVWMGLGPELEKALLTRGRCAVECV